MAFPVKVLDADGKLKRVISSKRLEERSDLALRMNIQASGYSSSHIPTEEECPECGVWFWKEQRRQKYCSKNQEPYCSQKAYKRSSKERGKRYRVKSKQKKAG